MIANELRIGNYLGGRNGMVTVSAIQEDGTVWLKEGGKNFIVDSDKPCLLPIPLTEEWLLKFGFTLTSIGGYFNIENKDELLYIFINKDSCGIAIENKYADADESEELSFNIKIQYVHQLQNLYFALTNEELTYEQ